MGIVGEWNNHYNDTKYLASDWTSNGNDPIHTVDEGTGIYPYRIVLECIIQFCNMRLKNIA